MAKSTAKNMAMRGTTIDMSNFADVQSQLTEFQRNVHNNQISHLN